MRPKFGKFLATLSERTAAARTKMTQNVNDMTCKRKLHKTFRVLFSWKQVVKLAAGA